MRKYLVLLWLLTPVGLIYFHYGPGQNLLAYDNAAEMVKRAEALEEIAKKDSSVENWKKVVDAYTQAEKIIGEEEDTMISRRLKLSKANGLMYQGELYDSMTQLESLLNEAIAKELPDDYTAEVRETLARCQFGAAWVMRLEGAETKLWTAEADKARQNFRLLAEDLLQETYAKDPQGKETQNKETQNKDSEKAVKELSEKLENIIASDEALDHQKNLESTVRMSQLDASTIKGLPLPKEAKNGKGKGLSDKMGEKGEGEGEGEGIGETQDSDARGKGASEGQRWQGVGS